MTHWVTPREMQDLDRRAIRSGTPEETLMERAGGEAAALAAGMLPRPGSLVYVFCGPGNNGGDGFV
ncbi:MAG TPA: NAD(P)H-hydrate epimerase, partial [Candidatus Fermentibacter daniensis]|nr:NAD(P)H-hydrate epimerase [Candidatus Fermentibacter daniensis]